MEEIGLPCSVITSHNECSGATGIVPEQTGTSANLPFVSLTPVTERVTSGECTTLSNVTVLEFVSVNVWPSTSTAINAALPALQDHVAVLNQTASKNEDNEATLITPRIRKVKRPYSPENHVSNKKMPERRKGVRKQKRFLPIPEVPVTDFSAEIETTGKPFSCDKCHSPFVVNPARSYRVQSRKKYRPRKVIDPVTNKLLVLCNACGLAMVREKNKKQEKHKKDAPTQEERDAYVKKAAEFAESLAISLQNSDARRLYCPSFKNMPCECLQKYINGQDEDEVGKEERASHLLTLLNDARQLVKLKTGQNKNVNNTDTISEQEGNEKQQTSRGVQKRRSKEFEDFVLKNRAYLRTELHLCERGVQKILLYSNNFLHKRLKTSPTRSCRISRTIGKNARGLLKPVSELVNEPCCNDKCVAMALTHSKLLEDWRATAKKGQREARRVLAEMLTPSGGTKANCYKFISMVTGCSYATICLVNEQMRRTQGEREPPEHGLKKWWRDHPRDKENQNKLTGDKAVRSDSDEDDPGAVMDVASIHIPSRDELESLCPLQLELQREKLLEARRLLLEQQAHIQQQLKQSKPKSNTSKQQQKPTYENKSIMLASTGASQAGGSMLTGNTAQQVLHILELPSSTPSVITSLAESSTQPTGTISVMTSTGDFEPLGNISVSLGDRVQTAFSNVVILPESALDTSNTPAQGTSVINYSPTVEAVDVIGAATDQQSSVNVAQDASKPDSAFQLYGVMDAATSNLLHFSYEA